MRSARGFTLIEIAVVIVIIAFIIAIFAGLSSGLLAQQRRQATINRLAAIDAALVQYVMQQKRLPCPADGSMQTGIELWAAGACTSDQSKGVVPWVTLGLPESDILDGWGRRITYRIDPVLAGTNRMDMSQCDPAGSGPLVGGVCFSTCTTALITSCTPPSTYLSLKGLTVKNVAGATLTSTGTPNTAAAYVLISHGESGGSGYLNSGVAFASTTTDGTEEQQNYASLAYTAGTSYYVDSDISDVAGVTHFDDIVMRPTILSVINRAGLGPRSH